MEKNTFWLGPQMGEMDGTWMVHGGYIGCFCRTLSDFLESFLADSD